MTQTINIAQVSIKLSETSFDLITLHQFLKLPLSDRHSMIRQQRVEFIDIVGDKIKLIDGLKAITELIKNLREEGKYNDYLSKGDLTVMN